MLIRAILLANAGPALPTVRIRILLLRERILPYSSAGDLKLQNILKKIVSKIGYFLAKTDPDTYPVEQLERDGETVWDGVKNPQALRAIRDMKVGDRVFLYHSMGEAAIVGVADIVREGRPDPKNPKLAVADFRFRGWVAPPVTLREIKESGKFEDWALVRQSRLSTMHAPAEFVAWLKKIRPKAPV